MKYYVSYTNVYHNGELIDTVNSRQMLVDEIKESKTFNLTWDNLDDFLKNHIIDFGVKKCKKGRKLVFYIGSFFNKNSWSIKEWKSDLNITIEIIYIERTPSLETLKQFEVTRVKKYLEELG